MLAQVILVSRLLGLVNGSQPIDVHAGANVRTVKVAVDGKPLVTLDKLPSRVNLNFGPELAPHEITAVALDANGAELARDTQYVNLGRPAAEAVIVFDKGRPTVHWDHLAAKTPKKVALLLDGKPVNAGAKLPPLDSRKLHTLRADVEFDDGVVATKELVFGSIYSEQVPAELTAVKVPAPGDCLQLRGKPVTAAAVENPEALILFVQDTDTRLARKRLRILGGNERNAERVLQQPFAIENALVGHIWPAAHRVERNAMELFDRSELYSGELGTYLLLTRYGINLKSDRFADAVAVAGVQAVRGGRRRAVVLVLTGLPDESKNSPAVVRRYLDRIGVPLHVWSLVDITPQMVEGWGAVADITSTERLRIATDALRADLEKQRIAWLPIAPLDAQHVRACE